MTNSEINLQMINLCTLIPPVYLFMGRIWRVDFFFLNVLHYNSLTQLYRLLRILYMLHFSDHRLLTNAGTCRLSPPKSFLLLKIHFCYD